MERYVCIHGHFYQPQRENPWLETIEVQDSAYPYHDWNERITAESYAPNARARRLGLDGKIEAIVDNYAQTSFNFGATLLSWMEGQAPETYAAIRAADAASRERFSGHGNALAQVHSHVILPLANERDRRTQVVWGIRDFERRFGRKPEGMWLSEAAVDLATLDLLAEQGLSFTILSPHSAASVRRSAAGGKWRSVDGGRIDPTMPYSIRLPSGRSFALFFYDGPISQAVAFEQLLSDGKRFAERLASGFDDAREHVQLVHIATDGETYGHHHRQGEMALAYALDHLESNGIATITNYGEHLERFPPTHTVRIHERSSWSCAHGVERWWRDCGCNSGMKPGWNQRWREPLRNALDWLRDRLAPEYERLAGELLRDPWGARDDYVELLLDRRRAAQDAFLERQAGRPLAEQQKVRALQLLEMQRNALLMYTSCGWFFDDLGGIETVQVIQYAARALQLARDAGGTDLEAGFKAELALARGNVPEQGTGADIYERFAIAPRIDLRSVGAHYAIGTLFDPARETTRVACYVAEAQGEIARFETGRQRFQAGRVRITSDVTRESQTFDFAALHLGDHNVVAGVRSVGGPPADPGAQEHVEHGNGHVGEGTAREAGADTHAPGVEPSPNDALVAEAGELFRRGEYAEVLRALDRRYAGSTDTVKSLFRDEQRRIVGIILQGTLAEAEATLRQLYDANSALMRFLASIGTPAPAVLRAAASVALRGYLCEALHAEEVDVARVRTLFESARIEGVELDDPGLALAHEQAIVRRMRALLAAPDDAARIREAAELVELAHAAPFDVDLSQAQNLGWELRARVASGALARDGDAGEWHAGFRALEDRLAIRAD